MSLLKLTGTCVVHYIWCSDCKCSIMPCTHDWNLSCAFSSLASPSFIMTGGSKTQYDVSALTIQKALDIARASQGDVDQVICDYLEDQLREIWLCLQAEPDSYILTPDEFALFNYYRFRTPYSELGQAAIQRFWDNYSRQWSSQICFHLSRANPSSGRLSALHVGPTNEIEWS
jgi:hypothetical protein